MRLLVPPEGEYVRDCVMYLRKSKGIAGIARQRRENEAHAREVHWRIIAEFEDTDTTAFNHVLSVHKVVRSDYLAMLQFLKDEQRRSPLGVLAWHADRLHREVGEAKDFTRLAANGRIPVETTMSGGYDLTKATGRKRFIRDACDAESEIDIMSERRQAGKRDSVLSGHWLGGPLPFGWQRVPYIDGDEMRRVLVLDPEQAEAIKWACGQVLRRTSLNKIAKEWNRRGLVTNGVGNQFTNIEVRRILLRPRNAALMGHLGKITRTDREDGKAEWPEIVSEDVWRAVVNILTAPDRRTSPPGPKPRWLGSLLYECGVKRPDGSECRGMFTVSGNGGGSKQTDGSPFPKKPAYRCRDFGHLTRNAELLDAFVEAVLVERLSRPDVRRVLAELEPPDLDELRAKQAIEEAALQEWLVEAAKPDASAALVAVGERAARERLDTVNAKIAAATESPILAEIVEAEDVAALWASKEDDLGWRRAALSMFVTVVLLPAKRGHPKGHKRGQRVFDAEAVRFDWKPLGGRPALA